MGLSQSSEVSDGGTFGYHVHGVSRQRDSSCFGPAYNDTAAYRELLLYAKANVIYLFIYIIKLQ